MTEPTEQNLRREYRIRYPLAERPTFEVGRFVYEVVDISEKGLRYEVKGQWDPPVGSAVRGKIVFRRGADVSVNGSVLRAADGVAVLALDPPLPFGEVLAEQRYLRGQGYVLKDL